jgi:hypothetical protein
MTKAPGVDESASGRCHPVALATYDVAIAIETINSEFGDVVPTRCAVALTKFSS